MRQAGYVGCNGQGVWDMIGRVCGTRQAGRVGCDGWSVWDMMDGASDSMGGASAWVGGTLRVGGMRQGGRQELVNVGGGGRAQDIRGVQDQGKRHRGDGSENRL